MTSHLWPLVAVILGLLAYRAAVSIFTKDRVSRKEFASVVDGLTLVFNNRCKVIEGRIDSHTSQLVTMGGALGVLDAKASEIDGFTKRLDARIPAVSRRLG